MSMSRSPHAPNPLSGLEIIGDFIAKFPRLHDKFVAFDAFFSFDGDDRDRVVQMANRLGHDLTVFVDITSMTLGEKLNEKISAGLENSSILVVVATDSLACGESFALKEIKMFFTIAEELRPPCIVLTASSGPPSLSSRNATPEWIRLWNDHLSNCPRLGPAWENDDAFHDLEARIRQATKNNTRSSDRSIGVFFPLTADRILVVPLSPTAQRFAEELVPMIYAECPAVDVIIMPPKKPFLPQLLPPQANPPATAVQRNLLLMCDLIIFILPSQVEVEMEEDVGRGGEEVLFEPVITFGHRLCAREATDEISWLISSRNNTLHMTAIPLDLDVDAAKKLFRLRPFLAPLLPLFSSVCLQPTTSEIGPQSSRFCARIASTIKAHQQVFGDVSEDHMVQRLPQHSQRESYFMPRPTELHHLGPLPQERALPSHPFLFQSFFSPTSVYELGSDGRWYLRLSPSPSPFPRAFPPLSPTLTTAPLETFRSPPLMGESTSPSTVVWSPLEPIQDPNLSQPRFVLPTRSGEGSCFVVADSGVFLLQRNLQLTRLVTLGDDFSPACCWNDDQQLLIATRSPAATLIGFSILLVAGAGPPSLHLTHNFQFDLNQFVQNESLQPTSMVVAGGGRSVKILADGSGDFSHYIISLPRDNLNGEVENRPEMIYHPDIFAVDLETHKLVCTEDGGTFFSISQKRSPSTVLFFTGKGSDNHVVEFGGHEYEILGSSTDAIASSLFPNAICLYNASDRQLLDISITETAPPILHLARDIKLPPFSVSRDGRYPWTYEKFATGPNQSTLMALGLEFPREHQFGSVQLVLVPSTPTEPSRLIQEIPQVRCESLCHFAERRVALILLGEDGQPSLVVCDLFE